MKIGWKDTKDDDGSPFKDRRRLEGNGKIIH